MPPEGPELEAAREKRKEWDREVQNIEGVFTNTGVIEPIQIDLDDSDEGNVLKQAIDKIESEFSAIAFEMI